MMVEQRLLTVSVLELQQMITKPPTPQLLTYPNIVLILAGGFKTGCQFIILHNKNVVMGEGELP